MKINTAVVLAYRRLAFSVLSIFFVGVVAYVGLVIFYAGSNTWASPLVLSPSQSKVLSFQPQVSMLVHNINKQKSELRTAMLTKQNIIQQLIDVDSMEIKLRQAIEVERRRTAGNAETIALLTEKKRNNIAQYEKAVELTKSLTDQINKELGAGLITSDQAAQRTVVAQNTVNNFTELQISAAEMRGKATELRDYSSTLGGANKSLNALMPTKQLMELAALRSQLQLQLDISDRNIEIIRASMSADNRILQVAMDSPYYRALFDVTHILFIPYENISHAVPGEVIYDCYLQVLLCRKVGTIDKVFEAEEYARHPLFKSDLKGKFATVNLTDKDAVSSLVLFIGSKPFLI